MELAPSGGIDISAQEGEVVDFKGQLVKELLEETPLGVHSISAIREIGIVEDLNNHVIDLCCLLEITDSGTLGTEESFEYKNLSWLKINELPHKCLVPTSIALIHLYEKKD